MQSSFSTQRTVPSTSKQHKFPFLLFFIYILQVKYQKILETRSNVKETYLSKLIKELNLIKIVKYRVQIMYSLYALEKLAYFAC